MDAIKHIFIIKYVLINGLLTSSFGIAVKNVYTMRRVRQREAAAVDRAACAARAVQRTVTMRMTGNRSVLSGENLSRRQEKVRLRRARQKKARQKEL